MYEKAGVRKILKKLCDYRNIEIVEGAVCADHLWTKELKKESAPSFFMDFMLMC